MSAQLVVTSRPDWPLADALNTLSGERAPSVLRVTRVDGTAVIGAVAGATATALTLDCADRLDPLVMDAGDIRRIEQRTFTRGRKAILWGTLLLSAFAMGGGYLLSRHGTLATLVLAAVAGVYLLARSRLHKALARWMEGEWASSWRVVHDARNGA